MLFRLIKVAGRTGGLLGYEWIEVLAVVPDAIEAHNLIRQVYICRTDLGLVQIMDGDLWPEVDEGEYTEDPRSIPAQSLAAG